VEVWGTGRPIREFLYVEDCADAILRAAELYNDTLPLNIGTGRGTAVRELVSLIREIAAFAGQLSWNTSKPDGQLKKVLNVSRMRAALQWSPPTDLRTGLRKTIEWYGANKEEADRRY
ncbi:MAG: NAD-dependent epimerase/dehydratase family protein, partial [Acidobacteria bacterium]|nr:NAD-dependent epimerase/dehydratase family protein [Acidobacteriota bacterium]